MAFYRYVFAPAKKWTPWAIDVNRPILMWHGSSSQCTKNSCLQLWVSIRTKG